MRYFFYTYTYTPPNEKELIYVGSTTDIPKRKSNHKATCNNPKANEYNSLKCNMMRKYGYDNFVFSIINTIDNITETEARTIEEQYRIIKNANLNTCKCNIDKDYKKTYHSKNKTKRNAYTKLYFNLLKDACYSVVVLEQLLIEAKENHLY